MRVHASCTSYRHSRHVPAVHVPSVHVRAVHVPAVHVHVRAEWHVAGGYSPTDMIA